MIKITTFIDKLPILYAELSFGTCLLLFVIYFVFDILYAKYILAVNKLRAMRSANISATLYVLSAIGTLGYVDNILYIIPIITGTWLGTYVSLTIASKYKIKKRNKK